jgi:predicted nucleotidyltransferase
MQAKLNPDEPPPALIEVFQSEPAVLAAWLFGSVASGRATPFSDVDFAVLLSPDAPTGLDRFVLLDRLARKLADVLGVSERAVDVAALNGQGIVFQYQVIRSGRLLHEANHKARVLFVWGVLRRYLDFRPTLAIFDRASGRQRSRIDDAPRPPFEGARTEVGSAGKDRAR